MSKHTEHFTKITADIGWHLTTPLGELVQKDGLKLVQKDGLEG